MSIIFLRMSRKIRQTKNNIVIVCEGSETEAPYFEDLQKEIETCFPDRFSNIRVVPVNEEKVKRSPQRPAFKRLLHPEYSYWVQVELSKELYDENKAQPLRYVREAQLFMENEGYKEAWAVFDHDNFPKRREAFAKAEEIDNLHIAFSSISFEEWILAHFERNPKAFLRSQCNDETGQSIKCESNPTQGCRGVECLASYLRSQGYIEDYDKDGSGLFLSLKDRLETARINAAWLRHLDDRPVYERNPYTDVDKLVARLLEIGNEYQWVRIGESFVYNGSNIIIEHIDDTVRIIVQDSTLFITKDNLINTDLLGNDSILLSSSLILSKGEQSCWFPVTAPYLRLNAGNKSFFIDLER